GGGEDSYRGALIASDSAEGRAKRGVGALQGCGRHPQGAGDATGPKSVPSFLERFASRNRGPRTQAQPGDEMIFGRKRREVWTDFGQDDLSAASTNSVDSSEVDICESPKCISGLLLPSRLDG